MQSSSLNYALPILWVSYFYFSFVRALIDNSDRSDEGLTLETSAFLPFTVANLRFQPSC